MGGDDPAWTSPSTVNRIIMANKSVGVREDIYQRLVDFQKQAVKLGGAVATPKDGYISGPLGIGLSGVGGGLGPVDWTAWHEHVDEQNAAAEKKANKKKEEEQKDVIIAALKERVNELAEENERLLGVIRLLNKDKGEENV